MPRQVHRSSVKWIFRQRNLVVDHLTPETKDNITLSLLSAFIIAKRYHYINDFIKLQGIENTQNGRQ
jgi:hypothetical protein